MGAVPPDELARLWAQEHLPPERAIGQIVQHLVKMQTTLDLHSQALAALRADLARLGAPPESPPVQTKRPPGRKR